MGGIALMKGGGATLGKIVIHDEGGSGELRVSSWLEWNYVDEDAG